MRKMEQRDLIMAQNTMVLLKRSILREVAFEEACGGYQVRSWLLEMIKEIEAEVKVNEAIASAKLVDPGPVAPAPQVENKAQGKRAKK